MLLNQSTSIGKPININAITNRVKQSKPIAAIIGNNTFNKAGAKICKTNKNVNDKHTINTTKINLLFS